MTLLCSSFYQRDDVVTIARELLGKWLITEMSPGLLTGGAIIETEAYQGITDKASHAYGGRRTKRTEVMFQKGGISYVYVCYGMHHLLNVVTSVEDTPHAVLIRAIHPIMGLEIIQERRGEKASFRTLASGPGSVCKALGITKDLNGLSFSSSQLRIEDKNTRIAPRHIKATPRIGVGYAEEDAKLPFRFTIDPSVFA